MRDLELKFLFLISESHARKLFRRWRGGEFLEAGIVPERIEHWIEPEQRRSERHVLSQ